MDLNTTTQFFQKLEGYAHKGPKTGTLNQIQAESAYKKMECQAPCQIPQEIKTKFGKDGLNTDAFNAADRLGTKDGLINDQELYKDVNKADKNCKPWTPPPPPEQGNFLGKNSAADKAGYASYQGKDPYKTADNTIKDVEGILGSANEGGKPDGKLSQKELEEGITLTQSHKGTVKNADAKLNLMKDMERGFANNYDDKGGNAPGGHISRDTLAREIAYRNPQ
jgi:hypothetical protein